MAAPARQPRLASPTSTLPSLPRPAARRALPTRGHKRAKPAKRPTPAHAKARQRPRYRALALCPVGRGAPSAAPARRPAAAARGVSSVSSIWFPVRVPQERLPHVGRLVMHRVDPDLAAQVLLRDPLADRFPPSRGSPWSGRGAPCAARSPRTRSAGPGVLMMCHPHPPAPASHARDRHPRATGHNPAGRSTAPVPAPPCRNRRPPLQVRHADRVVGDPRDVDCHTPVPFTVNCERQTFAEV